MSRALGAVVALLLVGAIGLAIVDMVGQSEHEQALVANGIASASTTQRDFGYVPKLVITDGLLPLRMTIHNQGAHTHTFTIDSLGVDEVIPRGETRTVTLRLPRPGRYRFYCRFHQAFGMRGSIVAHSG